MSDAPGPLPPPQIDWFEKALFVPIMEASDKAAQAHGVFDRHGAFLPSSRTHLSRARLSAVPEHAAPTKTLTGTSLYGGLARTHFGHFIVESITRLWALEHLDLPIDRILYTQLPGNPSKHPFRKNVASFFETLSPGIPCHVAREPIEVERLILPAQGFGHKSWISGTPEFRSFLRTRLAAIEPEGVDRIYISRASFSAPGQGVDREEEIEVMMHYAGYKIFRPEAFDFETQCATLKAARYIVGAEGSAFHMAAFLMHPAAKVAIFSRRQRQDVLQLLRRQIRSFSGVTPLCLDVRQRPLPENRGHASLDLETLRAGLRDNGFM